MTNPQAGWCSLCKQAGGTLIAQASRWRLVRAEEAGFPAFYRLIWNDHAREFSDLSAAERLECMEALAAVEQAIRKHLQPTKVNLATLGNVVPHLHWHIIARFDWDSHWPGPIWALQQRPAPTDKLAALEALRPALEKDLASLAG